MNKSLSKRVATLVFLTNIGVLGSPIVSMPVYAQGNDVVKAAVQNVNKNKEKSGLYEVTVKTLKENNDETSMAGGYLERVNYEIRDGKKYFILTLNRTDWMKNITATVDGNEINLPVETIEKNDKGEQKGKIRFEIGSLDSKIMLNMNVVPMGNAKVGFRIVPEKDAVKLIEEYKEEIPETKPDTKPETNPEEKVHTKLETSPEEEPNTKPETNPEEKPDTKPEINPEEKPDTKPETKPEVKPEEIGKSGLYELTVKTLQEKNDEESMAGSYLEKINYEIKEGKKYFVLTLKRTDWMKNITATVDGKEINPTVETIERNGEEEKGKIAFEIGSLDSKVMINMDVVPMGNVRVGFRIVPEKDT
ncbi:NEAT domain-containing protein, partial [Clostridium sporogenes]